jgi:outer membrane protein assembly factor BamB
MVEGDTVYVVGRDGGAWALDAANGRVRWTSLGVPSSSAMVSGSAPAVSGDVVLFPQASGELTAARRDTGDRVWVAGLAGQRVGRAYAQLVGDITGDPVVVGDTIYAGTAAGRTVALNATSGETLWNVGEGALNPPLVVGGSVFVVNDENRLVRLDAGSGEVIWAVEMPYWTTEKIRKRKGIVAQFGPVLAGGRLVVVGSDGQMRLFDPTNGALVSGADIPGGAASSVAMAGGVLYVVGGNGQLHAFR